MKFSQLGLFCKDFQIFMGGSFGLKKRRRTQMGHNKGVSHAKIVKFYKLSIHLTKLRFENLALLTHILVHTQHQQVLFLLFVNLWLILATLVVSEAL